MSDSIETSSLKQQTLVSIVIMTYNSADFILDTLESVKRQTYKNIELIVTDDASTDTTVLLCKDWIQKNKERFFHTEIVTTNENKGIPANCNRGVKKATGDWIKLIAGDDILVDDCLAYFMEAANNNTEIKVLAGRFQTFTSVAGSFDLDDRKYPKQHKLYFFDLEPTKQLKMLLTACDFGFAPSAFVKRELYTNIGYYNEEFKFIEDLPFWVLLSENGVKIHLLDRTVTYYRKGHGSMLQSNTNYFNLRYIQSFFKFKKKVVYPKVPLTNFLYYQGEFIEHFHYRFILFFFKNKKTKVSFLAGKFIMLFSINKVISKIKTV